MRLAEAMWKYPYLILFLAVSGGFAATVSGDLSQYGKTVLTFSGPEAGENRDTFLNHRLTVRFTSGEQTMDVPGFFAADGNAGRTHATSGNQWRARFTPPEAGLWNYQAVLVRGAGVAIDPDLQGEPVELEGATGSFWVKAPSMDRDPRDFRSQGLLQYVGKHHMQFSGSGRYFIKGGAGSPENFLAYAGFDGTWDFAKTPEFPALGADQLHAFEPHRGDWRPGDPDWTDEDGDDGKAIIGLVNYLAESGLNSLYFMPMTYEGDGNDVWPWVHPEDHYTFDVSKLHQWEILFNHMQTRGILLHILLSETENENLFELRDGGAPFADTRKLFYREMVARFAHHPALIWNLGEENGWDDEKGGQTGLGNSAAQRKRFSDTIRGLDPYQHPIKVHDIEIVEIFEDLLGHPSFNGPSLQRHKHYNAVVSDWLRRSREAGHPWLVSMDEPLGWQYGLRPDNEDSHHDIPRKEVLWGTFMAGGSGVEFYFGWQNNSPTSDLSAEDMRSRDRMWRQTAIAIQFFQDYLPFERMVAANHLIPGDADYVFALPGELYAVYLKNGDESTLDLTEAAGAFEIFWFNPRDGGPLFRGSVISVTGGSAVTLGLPPRGPGTDWIALVRKSSGGE